MYPISKISYSSLAQFHECQGTWKEKYILNSVVNKRSSAMQVGNMCHAVIELVLKGSEVQAAIENQLAIFEQTPDSEIKWWKTWSREKIIKDFIAWVTHYFEERPIYGKILHIEEKVETPVEDVIQGQRVTSPLPFVGKMDVIYEEDGEIIVEDFKFKKSHTKPESEDDDWTTTWGISPWNWIQGIFYFYICRAFLKRNPKEIRFREIKISKNRDGSSQINLITLRFDGEEFEMMKWFFWYILLGMIKYIEDADANTYFPYNVFSMQRGKESFDLLKVTQFWYKQKKGETSDFMRIEKSEIKETQFMATITPETIEEKIRYKLQEFWVALKYNSRIEWYAFDQYLFVPSRWVKMVDVRKYNDDISQATWFANVIVRAPVPGTKFVWVEIPRTERRFIQADEKITKMPIGINLHWENVDFDLEDPNTPHLIVAGKTWSGKSQFLKVLIEKRPSNVDLYLIDPKRVEFAKYKGISKGFTNEPQGAFIMLEKLYALMMKTYKKMEDKEVTNISQLGNVRSLCIIEEYANLRLDKTWWKDIEELVVKISNLWRAAWVHLILATQRPDVTIISGRIKANIWSRVCFSVASQIDSKIVLDTVWAEKLSGMWDMLYLYPGKELVRLQSYYI